MCSYIHSHLAMKMLYRSIDNDNYIIYGILPYHKADNDNVAIHYHCPHYDNVLYIIAILSNYMIQH